MPRKMGPKVRTKTVVLRVPTQQHEDLQTAARGLGIDVANLVRMIFTETLPTYIERGVVARRRAEAARAKVKKGEPGAAERPGEKTKGTNSAKPAEPDVRFLDV